jgi:tyrosine-protein kinase Etk/Wzc
MKSHSKRARDDFNEKSSTLNFATLVDIILVNRWLVLGTMAIFIVCGGLYAFLARPVYQSKILIQVEESNDNNNSSPNEFVGDVSSIIASKPTTDGEMQILGSKLVVASAVDALHLNVNAQPHYFPFIGRWLSRNAESLPDFGIPRFGNYAWGDDSIEVTRFDVPKRLDGASYKVTAQGNGMYEITGRNIEQPLNGHVGTDEQIDTVDGPIHLLIKSLHAPKGVTFNVTAYSRTQTIDRLQALLQITEQGTKSGILSATLTGEDPELLAATLNEVANQYVKQNANRTSVRAEASLAFLQSQLPAMKAEVDQAESRYNAYRNTHASIDMNEQTRLLLRQSSEAETALYQLQQRQQDLQSRYSGSYPQLALISKQIGETKSYLDSLQSRIKAMPNEEQGALQLAREVRVSTDLYASLRSNMERLQLLRAGKIGSVRIVDEAEVPEVPIKPRRQFILAAAAILGVFIGVGLAFARDMFGKGVIDPSELDAMGLNVYGSILLSERQEKLEYAPVKNGAEPRLLASLYPRDPAVESMRVLRTALQVTLADARNNVVLLTGPMPCIGKSFASANFAAVLASGGKRVLLVDADLRRGHLHTYLGLPHRSGLAEVLSNEITLDEAIQRDVVPNLDFLGTGTYPENSAELFLQGDVCGVIDTLSPMYDIVLIDAAAVLAVSDAGIVAPSAGSVFIMARYGVTRTTEMTEAVERLNQAGCKVQGVLLNGIPQGVGGYAYSRKYGVRAYGDYYESSLKQ